MKSPHPDSACSLSEQANCPSSLSSSSPLHKSGPAVSEMFNPAAGPSTPHIPVDDSISTCSTSSSEMTNGQSDSIEYSSEESTTSSSESSSSPERDVDTTHMTYKLVGDNIDKNVRPREKRSDVQTKSLMKQVTDFNLFKFINVFAVIDIHNYT